MIINVFKEGENKFNNLEIDNFISKKKDDDSEVQKIKSHLDITHLKYV